MMQIKAIHKHLRMSPQKVRLVLPVVRGRRPEEAVAYLRLMPQAAAMPVAKVIKSAAANAENNFSLDPAKLVITKATADVGPTMKRFMAAARGRAATIHRRTTHVTIIIEDTAPVAPKDSVAARVAKALPKRTRKPAKAAADTAAVEKKAKATETKTQTSKTPAKKTTKAASPAPKGVSKQTPETNDAGAESTPRRTNQQTGRGATTKANKKSSGNKGKDKS